MSPVVDTDGGTTRVLVVEDNPSDAYLLDAALTRELSASFITTIVRTLAEALPALGSEPACVLLDLGLPDSDGLATLDRVRTAAPDVAIVVVTGLEAPGLGQEAVARGAQDYLVKDGMTADALSHAITFAIRRKRVDAEAQASDRVRMARLSRRVKTLAAADALLGSSVDEASFTAGICDLLLEGGEYVGAWIAMQEEQGQPVEVIAAHMGWISESAGAESRAQHPALVALHASGHSTGVDLPFAPAGIAYDGADLSSRVRRVAAFAFTSSQRRGVLVLCSNQEHALVDNDELEILDLVATGIGFGLTSIRQQRELRRYAARLEGSLEQLTGTLATVVEYRDPYTAGHHREVAALAGDIARQLGLDPDTIRGIEVAAGIHDLGKICIPAEILAKPGSLTSAEFDLIKQHPTVGSEMLSAIDFPWPIQQMVMQHHERVDGSGYPSGLVGEEILLGSRVIAVADTINAFAAHRPYRASHGIDDALAYVHAERGRLFDPTVVAAAEAVLARTD